MHLSGPRIMLGVGITVVAAIWLLAIRARKLDDSAKLWQAGYVVAGWFLLMTINLFVGVGRS